MKQRKSFITVNVSLVSGVLTKDGWDSKIHFLPNLRLFTDRSTLLYNYTLKPVYVCLVNQPNRGKTEDGVSSSP